MNLSAPFILRPVMTTFVMLTIVVCGWLSYFFLPVSDIPTIEHPQIEVRASYAGANPDTMLSQVTVPLEKELSQVKGVEELVSHSALGSAHITMRFKLSKDMDVAVKDVQAALNRAEKMLPKDLDARPSYSRQTEGQEPIMYMLLTSKGKDQVGNLRNYAESYIIPRLSRIEGLAQVMVMGSSNSIWVRLNPELMSARRVSFDEVIASVKKFTAIAPLGAIQTSSKNIFLELKGKAKNIKEIENIYIANTSVRLKDIAKVSNKAKNEQEFSFVTPKESFKPLILAIQKVNDANTVAISKGVRQAIASLEKELPKDLDLNLWFDKAVWINESIIDVHYSLLFAFILVVVVIYLSLGRASEALIPSIALPLSLLGTFIFMYLLDFSLDLLSLLALTLAVGFVVDDAIVVLENIVRHGQLSKSPLQASLEGAKQIGFTILSMTLSLVAVFIPLLFMPGINGRLFREFSLTLAIAIIVSGFVSLSLTPMLCSKFLSQRKKETKLERALNAINNAMAAWYGKALKFCLCYAKSVLALASLSLIFVIPLFKLLPVNLLPPEDRGFLFAFATTPSGASAEEVKSYQSSIETLVKNHKSIDSFLSFNISNNLAFSVRLKPLQERAPQAQVVKELQSALHAIPGIQSFVQGYQLINLEFDLGAGGQYKYHLRGSEAKQVESAAEALVKALLKEELIASAQHAQSHNAPKLAIKVNEEYAHKLGLDKEHVQHLLHQAYSRNSLGTIQNGIRQDKIFIELQDGFRDKPAALSKLSINNKGRLIPLKAVAEWKEDLGPLKLYRRDQLPATALRFALNSSAPPQKGIQKFEDIAASVLPEGVKGSMSGSAKAISTAMSHTLYLLLAAGLVMYVILGILYESFIHPLTILSSLPFACLGGIITLLIFNEPISIFSAVGFLLLIGIVKKNGIMIVDYALEAQKEGLNPKEAIWQGCMVRFRPIMMTTVAAIMGALPIAIGFGEGAEMRRGLGLVIVGGLAFSQVLTLLVTPLLYLVFEALRHKISTISSRKSQNA